MLDFTIGFFVGGLGLSAGWGLFWLGVGIVGLFRKTCSWRVVGNSLTVGLVPILLIIGLLWWSAGAWEVGLPFGTGLLSMPVVLVGLGFRQAADGQRTGTHLWGGVRQLTDEVLGRHRECGGCTHEHDPDGCA